MLSVFRRGHSFWDKVGIYVSSVCFFHCAATPVLILTLPWLGEYFDRPWFHVLIFFLVVPIGLYAFLQGYGHHKHKIVLALGIPGLLLVGLGAFIPHEVLEVVGHETPTVLGSVLLISAHYKNRIVCCTHKH
jgi:hypothetical protein